jgi:L-serine dehydratase
MEHHLGLTPDPIGGLVQILCIERKHHVGVLKPFMLPNVPATMPKCQSATQIKLVAPWETAKDMNNKYKETSEGGLAIAVNMYDC